MSARALRRARLLRGLVVSASGGGLGIGGHLLAGGPLPLSPGLLLLLAVAAGACTMLSDRQWSFWRLLLALGGVQVLVHEAMGLQMGGGMGTGQSAGHLGAGGVASSASVGSNGWVMLAAHAGAAVATAWLLRQGEALFWRLLERLRPRRRWPTTTSPVGLALPAAASTGPSPARLLLCLAGCLARRGPPSLTAA
jgi:hypothetical protein